MRESQFNSCLKSSNGSIYKQQLLTISLLAVIKTQMILWNLTFKSFGVRALFVFKPFPLCRFSIAYEQRIRSN